MIRLGLHRAPFRSSSACLVVSLLARFLAGGRVLASVVQVLMRQIRFLGVSTFACSLHRHHLV